MKRDNIQSGFTHAHDYQLTTFFPKLKYVNESVSSDLFSIDGSEKERQKNKMKGKKEEKGVEKQS